jgi:elongation factor Ts
MQALMSQPFIKSESGETLEEVRKSAVASIGENISVRRFVRYELGAGLEKKVEDFAAEVAAQTAKKEEAPKVRGQVLHILQVHAKNHRRVGAVC